MKQIPVSRDKGTLRLGINEKLREFPQESRKTASERIRSYLLQSPSLARSECQTILLFAGLRVEPDLLPIISDPTHHWIFPRVTSDHYLELREVTALTELLPRTLGIREPDPELCPLVDPSEIDLVLVPGLGFTRSGQRLGRGGGYYDRLLAHPEFHAHKVGVCFDVQILTELPVEPHDRCVDAVVSESGWCGTGALSHITGPPRGADQLPR